MSHPVHRLIAERPVEALPVLSARMILSREAHLLLDRLAAGPAADDPQLDVALGTGGNQRAPRRTTAQMEVVFLAGPALLAVAALTALIGRQVGHVLRWRWPG